MKRVHNITFSVFCKAEDDIDSIESALLTIIPFNVEDEKLKLKKTLASGVLESKITILELTLEKERHTNKFLDTFTDDLSHDQKKTLLEQENRLDDDCHFFIRLDKQALIDGKIVVTDSGNCFHIKMSIAAFPKKKESARKIVQSIFSND
jgi:hypothetical protein